MELIVKHEVLCVTSIFIILGIQADRVCITEQVPEYILVCLVSMGQSAVRQETNSTARRAIVEYFFINIYMIVNKKLIMRSLNKIRGSNCIPLPSRNLGPIATLLLHYSLPITADKDPHLHKYLLKTCTILRHRINKLFFNFYINLTFISNLLFSLIFLNSNCFLCGFSTLLNSAIFEFKLSGIVLQRNLLLVCNPDGG